MFWLVLLVIFLCSTVSGDRIYTWGKAEPISSDVDNQSITSFDGFTYVAKDNGVFEVWKNGVKQARFIFAFKGTFNASPVTALSTDYAWDWSFIENTEDRIELEGKRQDFNSVTFPLKVNLVAERYKHLKFTYYIENKHETKDVTDLEMFFVFDINTTENPSVNYTDENGTIKSYNYNTNINRTDKENLANIDLRRITSPKFSFLFQDIIDNNYFLTRLYFGNLGDLDNNFPDTNGFLIGISKGSKRLNAGTSHTIDPTLAITNADLDGDIRFQDGVFSSVDEAGGVIDIGLFAGDGLYRWERGVLEFDISGLRGVTDANFNIYKLARTFTGVGWWDEKFWDINSVATLSPDINVTDWNSTTFEQVKDNWFDDSITTTKEWMPSVDISTAWNNSITAGRNYLALRIALDDDLNLTTAAVDMAHNVDFCSTEGTGFCTGNGAYIEYNLITNLDVNVTAPGSGNYLKYSDGNFLIQFDIINNTADTNDLFTSLYYSTTKFAVENSIIQDLNLLDMALNPTVDANCTLNVNGFASTSNCVYDWDFSGVSDGNYFLDANAFIDSDTNWVIDSGTSFFIDSTLPTTTDDANNTVWQNTDANVILSCTDGSGSGCLLTQYRLDTDDSNTVSFGAWTNYDTNIFVNADGNWGIDYNSSDFTGNLETTNRTYVYLDLNAPTTIMVTPDSNKTTADSTPTFDVNVSDGHVSVSSCGVILYVDDVATEFDSSAPVAGVCSYTVVTDLTEGQVAVVDWNALDSVGNQSDNNRSFAYTYNATVVVVETGGGGGGGVGEGTNFSVLSLGEDEKKITIFLSKVLDSEFVLLVENTGTRDINGFQIVFSENLLPFIENIDVNNPLLIGKVEQYEYLFKTSDLPEDTNSISGSVFFFGNGVTQRYDIEFVFEDSLFADILSFLNQGVLPLPFGVINLNGLLLIASGVVFVGLPRFIKLGATPQLVLAVPILGFLITAFFVGVIV